mmetsp:Transcript_7104/g.11979  ORF Transcript_7104/g.11979 Transcript_7104/m.11979 type:complete len:85 (+) Transcript_7104:310-564(+)
MIGLKTLLEPIKKHPRDCFNLGRLKVMLIDDLTEQPMSAELGTCKRKMLIKIANKFPEAQLKYDEILAQQKESAEKNRQEMLKL